MVTLEFDLLRSDPRDGKPFSSNPPPCARLKFSRELDRWREEEEDALSLPSPPARDTLTILEDDRSSAVPASTA